MPTRARRAAAIPRSGSAARAATTRFRGGSVRAAGSTVNAAQSIYRPPSLRSPAASPARPRPPRPAGWRRGGFGQRGGRHTPRAGSSPFGAPPSCGSAVSGAAGASVWARGLGAVRGGAEWRGEGARAGATPPLSSGKCHGGGARRAGPTARAMLIRRGTSWPDPPARRRGALPPNPAIGAQTR